MKFIKMHGAGNDYIYLDCFFQKLPTDPAALAVRLSDRNFGIGGDGLILIAPSQKADARMIMFNADGSEAEMCGNGIRCVAKYVFEAGIKKAETLRIETGSGVKEIGITLKNGKVEAARVNMGAPVLLPRDIPMEMAGEKVVEADLPIAGQSFRITAVGMGNPHCVIYVEDVKAFDVPFFGPQIERHALFPQRTNVEFVQVVSPGEVIQRTWERGSGETLACGTGASAVCVAGALTGRTDRKIVDHLKGGDLALEWPDDDSPVFMTGPCVEVFRGEVDA